MVYLEHKFERISVLGANFTRPHPCSTFIHMLLFFNSMKWVQALSQVLTGAHLIQIHFVRSYTPPKLIPGRKQCNAVLVQQWCRVTIYLLSMGRNLHLATDQSLSNPITLTKPTFPSFFNLANRSSERGMKNSEGREPTTYCMVVGNGDMFPRPLHAALSIHGDTIYLGAHVTRARRRSFLTGWQLFVPEAYGY